METVRDFILGGSKVTADGDCSQEIKRGLLLGRKPMTHLDSILKNGDITLPTKVHLVIWTELNPTFCKIKNMFLIHDFDSSNAL